MLQRIHDSVGRWVAGIILGLLAVGFVFWGVDFSLTGSTFAAKVNGTEIPVAEFERELQAEQNQYQQRYRTELDDDLRRALRRGVLENMVRDEALKQRVESAGYRVSDQRLSDFIRSVAAFQVDGEFSMVVYRGQLSNQGLTPAAFEALQRERLALLELQGGIAESTFLTPAEFRRYIELYNQRREIAYALFEVDAFLDRVEVDDAAIAEHYEANRDRYMTQETVDMEYIELAQADIASTVEVTDEQLQGYYEEQRDRFETEPERRARHVLITIDDDQAEQAEAKAAGAAQRIRNGEDFAAVAKELSDDAGTKDQGGDLGWISRGMLPGPFEDALFAMQVGDVSDPVRTDFGYHVIRLDDVREGETRSFEDVRDELRAEYRNRLAEDDFYERANRLADRAFDAYDELATVATEMGVPLKTVQGFPRTGDSALFENSAPAVAAAFSESLEQGTNSELVQIDDDHALVLRVTAHHAPELRPLDTVRDRVLEEVTRERARELAVRAADAVLTDVRDEGGDPAAAAEARGGAWMAPAWRARTDAEVPTELLAAAFGLPTPAQDATAYERVSLADGNEAVLLLSGVESGSPERVGRDERDQRQRQLADQSALAELSSYVSEVRDEATVRIPEEILEPQY